MWQPQLLLFFLTTGLAAGCDEDACNIGIAAGVGVANTCAAVGGLLCWFTFGIGCIVAAGCKIAGAIAAPFQSECVKCKTETDSDGLNRQQLFQLQDLDKTVKDLSKKNG